MEEKKVRRITKKQAEELWAWQRAEELLFGGFSQETKERILDKFEKDNEGIDPSKISDMPFHLPD